MSGRLNKIGDWDKIQRITGALAKEMENARKISLKRWGLKAEGFAKSHISKQDLNWKPLEPATIAQKIRKGYSENILVATSSYFQSITSWSDGERAYAGVKKTAKDADGNVIADIAATHEFGSKSGKIPARPLWKPVFDETMEWFDKKENQPATIFMQLISKYL